MQGNAQKKIEDIESIIENTVRTGKKPILLFTADKESTVFLELIKGKGIPVVFIDTGGYSEEIYKYLNIAQARWGFNPAKIKFSLNIKEIKTKEKLFKKMLGEVVFPYMQKQGIEILFSGIDLDNETIEKEGISIVSPLSGLSDIDIWRFIKENGLPYCELYNKGIKDIWDFYLSNKGKLPKQKADDAQVEARLKALGYM